VQRAIDLAPNDSRWPVRLGIIYFSSGKLEEAAAAWQKGAELDPQNNAAFYDLGLARDAVGSAQ